MADTQVLLVPILVDALPLTHDARVVGGPAFENLPFVAAGRDQNLGVPFLAETAHAPPFGDDTLTLAAGVHLHWTLPRALRTATHPVDNAGVPDPSTVQFRRAPDRWLIVRRAKDQTFQRGWYVEGDYVWPAAAPDGVPNGSAVWPWALRRGDDGIVAYDPPDGEPPWRNVGRAWALSDASGRGVGQTRVELRADGWGDATFAAYYPSCRQVFGLWDDDVPTSQATEYEVFGWYGDPAADPLVALAARPGVDLRKQLAAEFGWALPTDGALPQRIMCVGKLSSANFTGPAAALPEFALAVANSGTEALAALLADELARQGGLVGDEARAERTRLESHLDALLLSNQLKGQSVDIGAQLAQLRHRRGFRAVAGSVNWVLRPRGADQKPDAGVVLPPSVAAAVDTLNAAQDELDRGLAAVDALRQQVFADWYRAIKVTDPPRGENLDWVLAEHDPTGTHDADAIYALLRNTTLPALATAEARVSFLQQAFNLSKAAVDTALAAHNAVSSAPTWALDAIPGPRYFAPADPCVALLAREENSRDRWGEDGLTRDTNGNLWTQVGPVDLANLAASTTGDGVTTVLANLDAPRAALFKAASLDLTPEHVHMFAMEWEVQFAPIASTRANGSRFPDDWLERPPEAVAPTEIVAGTALLVQNTAPVLASALFAWLRSRLSAPLVGFDPAVGAEVHPLTAALCPPSGMVWKSWSQILGVEEVTEARVSESLVAIDLWARELVDAERLTDAAGALAAYAEVALPGARTLGIANEGALARAIAATLAADGRPGGRERFFEDQLTLPAEAVANLLAAPLDSPLVEIAAGTAAWGGAPIAALLRQAEAEGRLGLSDDEAYHHDGTNQIRELPFVLGLPQGGAVEAGLCATVNGLSDTGLLDDVGLRAEIVGPLLEARPVRSLAALAALPHVTAHTFARLLAYAERTGVFTSNPVVQDTPTASVRSGGAPTGATADPLRTALEAWRVLGRLPNAVVHSLSGFHDALLQWSNAPQFPVADPVGFPDYSKFAKELVRPAVRDSVRRAPRPEAPFHPLRAGELRVQRLRLVDTFGQVRDLPVGEVITPADCQASAEFHTKLDPRIVQPARLDLRWCAADGHGQEWTPHPSTTPICGWLAANNAEGSLLVYDTSGSILGELDAGGRWRVAPGSTAPVRPEDIDNMHLQKVVVYLAAQAAADDPDEEPGFIEFFTGLLDQALDNIHPPESPNEEALGCLMSRPIAVVRATVGVELRDPPATRQDAAALVAQLNGAPADTLGFEAVGLPIRIGDHKLLGDGTVAWWTEDASGALVGLPHFPLRGDGAVTPPIAAADAPSTVTLLLLIDPHGAVHASCDVLPTRTLKLPKDEYTAALADIELRSFTGPVLTPVGELHLPVPKEAGWTTSMITLRADGWRELGPRPQVERAVLEAAFPEVVQLWSRLIDAGVLAPLPDRPAVAELCPPPPPTSGAPAPELRDLLSTFAKPEAIERVLLTRSHRLDAPAITLPFLPLELRDGWLRLRRTAQ